MLEPQLIGIGARHLERLVIALSGALAIWLGYRLFLSVAAGVRPRAVTDLMTWHCHRGRAVGGGVQ
jgi:hypothetical protein